VVRHRRVEAREGLAQRVLVVVLRVRQRVRVRHLPGGELSHQRVNCHTKGISCHPPAAVQLAAGSYGTHFFSVGHMIIRQQQESRRVRRTRDFDVAGSSTSSSAGGGGPGGGAAITSSLSGGGPWPCSWWPWALYSASVAWECASAPPCAWPNSGVCRASPVATKAVLSSPGRHLSFRQRK
jgi:hypothetical protein